MKICKFKDATIYDKGNTVVYEYESIHDTDINGAYSVINGRFPEAGFSYNEKCKEMVYVVSGKGTLTIDLETFEIEEGDTILILPKEKFYWVGDNLKIFIPCTPAWYPEQYKSVD
jgi:mannose-6-phosphate isomerase-like protein (cupin superfamily)